VVTDASSARLLSSHSPAHAGLELGHMVPAGVAWSKPIVLSSVVDQICASRAPPQDVVTGSVRDVESIAEGALPRLHPRVNQTANAEVEERLTTIGERFSDTNKRLPLLHPPLFACHKVAFFPSERDQT
jgi:hypothetical protein